MAFKEISASNILDGVVQEIDRGALFANIAIDILLRALFANIAVDILLQTQRLQQHKSVSFANSAIDTGNHIYTDIYSVRREGEHFLI